MTSRKAVPIDARSVVLHECGYRCANPACRMVLTLEIHHLERVSDGGSNVPTNLLPLCPNCHTLHHSGVIPQTSLRAWKHLLLALNQAFDTRLVDLLLSLRKLEAVIASGDGVLQCAQGVASGLIEVVFRVQPENYVVRLTAKGRRFVERWEAGDEQAAIGAA
jgi:HNH endonuclease